MTDTQRTQTEQVILDATRAGEIADFTSREDYNTEDKPTVAASFLRRLLLGIETDARILKPGVRIAGARVEGLLDLSDSAGPDGGLPALALEHCDLPFPVMLSGARFARVSFNFSRITSVMAEGARIDGDFSFNTVKPMPGQNVAHVNLYSARIGGDVWGCDAQLMLERPVQVGNRSVSDALGAQGAQVRGMVVLYNLSARGRVSFLNAVIGSALDCGGIRIDNKDAMAFVATNCSVGGDVILGPRAGKRAELLGQVDLYGARIRGSLVCAAGRFIHPNGLAIFAQAVEVGIGVDLSAWDGIRFESKGEVNFSGAKVGGSFVSQGGSLSNPNGCALRIEGAEVKGSVLLRPSGDIPFDVEGQVNMLGIRVGLIVELSGAHIRAGTARAISLSRARIGELNAGNNTIEGSVSLSGARIDRLLDDPETAWAQARQIGLDELSFEHIGVQGSAQVWRARATWLRRNVGTRKVGILRGSVGRFSNQPWRTCINALIRAGLHGDARRLAREEQREANRHRGQARYAAVQMLSLRERSALDKYNVDNFSVLEAGHFDQAGPQSGTVAVALVKMLVTMPVLKLYCMAKQVFVWLFAEQMFGYGLSASRAALASALVWAIGWAGTEAALSRGALVREVDGVAQACGRAITPPLFALDIAVPVLDLGQESECKPGAVPGATLRRWEAPPGLAWTVINELDLWRWAKALYAIVSATVIGFAILTWTGVFRPQSREG